MPSRENIVWIKCSEGFRDEMRAATKEKNSRKTGRDDKKNI